MLHTRDKPSGSGSFPSVALDAPILVTSVASLHLVTSVIWLRPFWPRYRSSQEISSMKRAFFSVSQMKPALMLIMLLLVKTL